MNLADLPALLLSGGIIAALVRLVEVLANRRKTRSEGRKVDTEGDVLLSTESRAWAARADARAEAAEKRADALLAKLDELSAAMDKLEGRIARCQAGPVCPVRTADGTDPRMRPVT